MKNSWTIPKLKSYPENSEQEWYVWFRFNNKPVMVKKGINQILDLKERELEGKALAKALEIQLEKGWIPNSAKNYTEKVEKKTILEVADISFKLKAKQVDEVKSYRTAINFFKKALKELKMERLNSFSFERSHAKRILTHLKEQRKWTNQNYNKYIGLYRTIFYEGLDLGYFKTNPFGEIRNLKTVKKLANTPPTDEEMKLICEELKIKNYGFYIFFMLIYHCGIRPKELILLKIKDLDFETQYIKIQEENAKNDKFRKVPMVGNVYALLQNYKGLDDDLFVFGTWVSNGGCHSQKNWFKPNKFKLKRDTPNRQWKKLIKDGLGINKNLYSGKHKGADDKLNAGMNIKTICSIFGHSETSMTERYTHSLTEKRLEESKKYNLKNF